MRDEEEQETDKGPSMTQAAIQTTSLCADCDAPNASWASINNGVLICTSCAGVHRGLGVDISFVQSVTLDIWSAENIATFCALHSGDNDLMNQMLEHHVPANILKPNPYSTPSIRETFIVHKYKLHSFSSASGLPRQIALRDCEFVTDEQSSSSGAVQFIGVLEVQLISAQDLLKSDTFGLSDPYCILSIGSQSFKSKCIKRTLNPQFNEKFMFSWDGKAPLVINMVDKDTFKADDPLGYVLFELSPLYEAGMLADKELSEFNLKLQDVSTGTIQFSITLNLLI